MNAPAANSTRSPLATLLGVIFIVAVGLALVFYLRKPSLESGALEHPAVGVPLKSLSFAPLVGTESKLRSSELEGKVTLINYWGTWCGPCRVEFPHMVELYDRFGTSPDFALVSVSLGYDPRTSLEDLKSETAAFVQRENATFPVYDDSDGANRSQFAQLTGAGGGVVPQTILLDQQGVIRAVWTGYRPGWEEEMAAEVSRLLNGNEGDEAAG